MERTLTPRGAATKARIVHAAAVLIRRQGAAATNLDDIRRATETSKSQLFHYFPGGRAELLTAVVRYEADLVLEEQRPLLAELGSWDGWLRWRRVMSETYPRRGTNSPLGSLIVHLGATSAEAVAIIEELFDAWERSLADGVRALRAAGETGSAVKAEEVARSILAAVQGGVCLLQVMGRGEYLEAGLDSVLAQLRG